METSRPIASARAAVSPPFLPIFAKNKVSWYQWGLVAGETQTYMHWGSKKGDPEPDIWQHDVFHKDGKPYDPKELGLVKQFEFLD